MSSSPAAYAIRIGRIVQEALGASAYPLDLPKIVKDLSPVLAPGVSLSLESADLSSMDGALIGSADGRRYTILLNSRVRSAGRRNFTLAHELGHFLCHRRAGLKCSCGEVQLTSHSAGDPEAEANHFASLLLLPRNLVRSQTEAEFSFSRVSDFASRMGTSVAAAALAIIETASTAEIGFAVVVDGFIKWGRASEQAYKSGLYFRPGNEVPQHSVCAFEGVPPKQLQPTTSRIPGWGQDGGFFEDALYIPDYQCTYLFLQRRKPSTLL